MAKTTKAKAPATEEVAAQTTPAAPAISLNDLQVMTNIIDVCTKRGAFEGTELLAVGQIREKLVAFIKSNMPSQAAEISDEEVAEEAAE